MVFMVSKRGIEANPKSMRVIVEIKLPMNLNEVQKLVGKIEALNKFVSRSNEKCLPLFQALKKVQDWNIKCEKAFKQLKEYLTCPHCLARPGMRSLYCYTCPSCQTPSQ